MKTVHKPDIIFEGTGVYSRRLQAFVGENSYTYIRLNPLEAKKQFDSLRVRKTDNTHPKSKTNFLGSLSTVVG